MATFGHNYANVPMSCEGGMLGNMTVMPATQGRPRISSAADPSVQDRIHGMLLMHALGDAVGAPHERIGKRGAVSLDTYTGVVSDPIVRNSRWQGRRVSVVGQITDDHEMLCALGDNSVGWEH